MSVSSWDCFCVKPNLNHTIADRLIIRLPEPSSFFSLPLFSHLSLDTLILILNYSFSATELDGSYQFFGGQTCTKQATDGDLTLPCWMLSFVWLESLHEEEQNLTNPGWYSSWSICMLYCVRSLPSRKVSWSWSNVLINDIPDTQKSYLTALKPFECVSVEFLVWLLDCWSSWSFTGLTLCRHWFHASFFSPTPVLVHLQRACFKIMVQI